MLVRERRHRGQRQARRSPESGVAEDGLNQLCVDLAPPPWACLGEHEPQGARPSPARRWLLDEDEPAAHKCVPRLKEPAPLQSGSPRRRRRAWPCTAVAVRQNSPVRTPPAARRMRGHDRQVPRRSPDGSSRRLRTCDERKAPRARPTRARRGGAAVVHASTTTPCGGSGRKPSPTPRDTRGGSRWRSDQPAKRRTPPPDPGRGSVLGAVRLRHTGLVRRRKVPISLEDRAATRSFSCQGGPLFRSGTAGFTPRPPATDGGSGSRQRRSWSRPTSA